MLSILLGVIMEKAKALFSYSLSRIIEHYMELTESKQFDWKIYKGDSKSRYERIKDKKFTIYFKKHFEKIYNIEANATTIISYFDTLSLIQRLIKTIDDKVLNDIHVYMEFQIPYAENKRTDFIFVFKNTMLLLEMGSKPSKSTIKFYNEKLVQVMQYEKLIQNLISPKINTIPYVILYDYEYDHDCESENHSIDKNIDENTKRIKKLAELIQTLYHKDSIAIQEIDKLIGLRDDY